MNQQIKEIMNKYILVKSPMMNFSNIHLNCMKNGQEQVKSY